MTEYVSDYMVSINEDKLGWASEPEKEYVIEGVLEDIYSDENYDFSRLKFADIDNENIFDVQIDIENYIQDNYGYEADTHSNELERKLIAIDEDMMQFNYEFYRDVIKQLNRKIVYLSVELDGTNMYIVYDGSSNWGKYDVTDYTVDEVVMSVMSDRYNLYGGYNTPEEQAIDVANSDPRFDTSEEFLEEFYERKTEIIKELEYIKYSLEHPVLG